MSLTPAIRMNISLDGLQFGNAFNRFKTLNRELSPCFFPSLIFSAEEFSLGFLRHPQDSQVTVVLSDPVSHTIKVDILEDMDRQIVGMHRPTLKIGHILGKSFPTLHFFTVDFDHHCCRTLAAITKEISHG